MNGKSDVLMIAYYFPPMGGAGVQRTLKFVKYLPEYGWQPHVLTIRNSSRLQDSSLASEIPDGSSVTRTHILHLPSQWPWRLRNFISRWLLIVDGQIGWLPFANNPGRRVIEEHKVRVIYSTSAPYTAHLIARRLQRQTHLPWVADFRDPWTGNTLVNYPTEFHWRINKRLEHSVFNNADRVILNTERSLQYYTREYPDLPAGKLVTIPNGYDLDDIPNIRPDQGKNTIFTIVHLGSLYHKTRSSEFFLTALRKALDAGNLVPDKIRVRFIGNIDRETQAFVKKLKLEGNVDLLGYLPHQKALSQLFAADLLLLIPSHGAGSELFVPAKLYEYLACKKPIFCLADPGDCADLIHRAHSGVIVPPTDIDKIIDQLVSLFHLWQNGQLSIEPDLNFIQTFERRHLTGQLAGIFDQITEKTA
jgi:glycosyltransferase involved in cell wall biosynthesis